MENRKYVYLFTEGNAQMKELLGGKGANLAEMTGLGIPIPFGFTVTTEACTKYYEDGQKLAANVRDEIMASMKIMEEKSGKHFGGSENPLLVSVRSGSRASMPGMMDTILNLGLNDQTVEVLAKETDNERFAFDSYRRFITMFSDVVMGVDKGKFEQLLHEMKDRKGLELDTELNAADLRELTRQFKELYRKEKGEDFPQDPEDQLLESVTAVFRSWDNPRANVYRRLHDIPYSWGTAVNVQAMVFGNKGETSGTGVAFSRNPSTGEDRVFAEYLMNAQGEDVVAGIRTPNPIEHLQEQMPEVYQQFIDIVEKLEQHYKDMQDMEFTIEEGKLYFLQTRSGKRTAQSALKVAVDMEQEGLITKEEGLLMMNPRQLDTLLHPAFDAEALEQTQVIASGLPASPGAASGRIAFTAAEAKERHEKGEQVILVRQETSPEDIEGMVAAEGILTVRGGMTSHAAVVARGMGKCCVAGAGSLVVSEASRTMKVNGRTYTDQDYISLDGSAGNVYEGEIATVDPEISGDFETFMGWADEIRVLGVRTNADTPHDTAQAVSFGAEGIGLTRTEHMFFGADRIPAMREMIVSRTKESREKALAKILPMQKEDFIGIFKALEGRPATIRFLDPPLHEFLPTHDEEIETMAGDMNLEVQDLKDIVSSLHEFNPMMGHRGIRLAVTYPEIAVMQTRAIIEAALEVRKETGWDIVPELMLPLIGDVKEMVYVKNFVVETADAIIKESGDDMKYLVGTMIEIPRACIVADEIAREADFFSFGTNDLTQMGFGFSRDDAGTFLKDYYEKKVYESDPFQRIDQKGIGRLVELAVELGREANPALHLGVCGEHGGDPSSVEFFHRTGLDYVSCSPYRVPVARLAAAQAEIKWPRQKNAGH